MEGVHSSSRLCDRSTSRTSSSALNDARRGSVHSHSTSLLPYSTASDGSDFLYSELSTLSRAVLHTSEDDEADRTARESRPGWHRRRYVDSTDDDRYEQDEKDGERRDDEEGEGEAYREAKRHQKEASTKAASFRSSTFRSEHGSGFFTTDRRSGSFDLYSHQRVSPRKGPAFSMQSAVDNTCDAVSPSANTSRPLRLGQRRFSASRSSHYDADDFGGGGGRGEGAGGAQVVSTGPSQRSRRTSQPLMLPSMIATTSARASIFSGEFSDRASTSSPMAVVTSPSSSRQRRSALAMSDGSESGGQLRPPSRRGGDAPGAAPRVDEADWQKAGLPSSLPAPSSGDDASYSPSRSVQDHVWPYTQPFEVRLVMTEVRKRIEWNDTTRQFLLLIPLLFFVGFLAAYNTKAIQADLLVTESQRQLFTRTPFPSAVTALEQFRQQKNLDVPVSVRTDSLFVEMHTQADWIDFFADVVMPGIFQGVAMLLHPETKLDARGDVGPNQQSSANDGDGCFAGDRFWFDRPGCVDSLANGDREDDNVKSLPTAAKEPQASTWPAASHAGFSEPSLDAPFPSHSNVNPDDDSRGGGSNSGIGSGRRRFAENYLYDKTVLVGPAQSIYLGAMRVRTIRMKPHTAKLQRRLYPRDSQRFPSDAWSLHHNREDEETTPVRCPSITLTHPLTNASAPLYIYRAPAANDPYCVPTFRRFGTYHCGGYTFDVPFRSSTWVAMQYRQAVRNVSCFFVDNWATRLIAIEFYTYTPDHDTFHSVKLYTEVLAGGSYHTDAVYRSFRVWTPARTGELVYVSFTCAYTVFYFACLLSRLRWQVRRFGWVAVLQDWSAWMDLIVVTSVVLSVAYFYAWSRVSRRIYANLAIPMVSSSYPSYLDSVQRLHDQFNTTNALSVIVCFARLFFCRALFRPFTTLVTALDLSIPAMLSIAVLYMVMVIGYALVGHAVFGPIGEWFTNFGEALYAVLSYWYAVPLFVAPEEDVARQFTSFFFWSLTVGVLSVTVALYIAVVSHSFARVRAVYGVTYDEPWSRRRLEAFWECCTWPRIKRFLRKMALLYPENEYLFRVLQSMNAAYRAGDVRGWERRGVVYADESHTPLRHRSSSWGGSTTLSGRRETSSNSFLSGAGEDDGRHVAVPNFISTSSSMSPMSFSDDNTKRLRTSDDIVEGQSVGQSDAASVAVSHVGSNAKQATRFSARLRAATEHATSSAASTGAENAAHARRLAALAFSAEETQSPLPSASPFHFRRAAASNRSKSAPLSHRRSSPNFHNPVRRTSDALREVYEELRDINVAQRHINFFDWCDVIQPDVFVSCGGESFFKEWWKHMAETQADVSRTPQQQARRELREMVAFATEREVTGGVVGIGHLERTLSRLESHVDSLLQNVSRR
ncbi:hypothetical protein ABB37_03355 [Leptomonas pyrrhocoris]|uniref:Uncharacterized protein n=1 Tax=Leptomonas pyrrhocoris TaxID=157538 RepID=A0A0N0DX01_LEPPY|nr:hypothetical protein ABB37_03355 [Leptomonas pyrrhocoris]KPA82242.1 hypothetical protein ABB37_03355 [Leptomonas pyrrhocoris]|eukprot:XP_015660681.1 hypothetical protein ABB37_03355 [Leptomonas pyrrhocoris]